MTPHFRSTASSIEFLESRIAPAALIGKNVVTYTDFDGDIVTVTFSKPLLTDTAKANAVFSFSNSGGNIANPVNGDTNTHEYLTKIDLTSLGAAANGIGIKVTAKQKGFGDGLATVGTINAPGNLGVISIHGDLGQVNAVKTTNAKTALQALNVTTLGRYGTLGGATTGASVISGDVGTITTTGDFSGKLNATNIKTITIGGSLVGGLSSTGNIDAVNTIGTLKIVQNIQGGSGAGSGEVVASVIKTVTVGGSIIGGTAGNTGEIAASSSLGKVKVGHDLIAGTASFAGAIDSNGVIGSITLGGSIIGTTAQPATISAKGIGSPATQAASIAIASITVAGRVEHGQILAGYEYTALSAANGDASIGAVMVKGDWIASDLVAGVKAGADGRYGQRFAGDVMVDDGVIANGIGTSSVRAKIGLVSIGGSIQGTVATNDSYAFTAEDCTTFKLAGVKLTTVLVNGFAPLTKTDVVLETFVI